MQMISVNSSNLSSVGYENGNLYIQFHNGGLYCYHNVPENIYLGLLSAGSKGKYHAAYIKKILQLHKDWLINNRQHDSRTVAFHIKLSIWFCYCCFYTLSGFQFFYKFLCRNIFKLHSPHPPQIFLRLLFQ